MSAPGLCTLLGPSAGAGAFCCAAGLLSAAVRHRHGDVRRCMALLTAAARALLATLVRWHFTTAQHRRDPLQGVGSSLGLGRQHSALEAISEAAPEIATEGVDGTRADWDFEQREGWRAGANAQRRWSGTVCAEELARVYSAVADHKEELSKYCSHLLADYISLVLLPLPTASDWSDGGHWMGESEVGKNGALAREAAAILRGGAYAIYGACGPAEVRTKMLPTSP